MQKFESLNFTYKEVKEEHESVKLKIEEDIHKGKSDIVNYNKCYKQELDIKQENQEEKQIRLEEKEKELNKCVISIDKDKVDIRDSKDEIERINLQLEKKEVKLNKIAGTLEGNNEKLQVEKNKWTLELKDKKKKADDLSKYINWVRKEDKEIKEQQDLRIQEITQQKHVLDLQEKRLEEKKEKIQSEMKTLLSAKNFKS